MALTEHDWVSITQLAARKDEKHAKQRGPEFYKEYLKLVKQMEENEKNGIECTYDVGYDC